MEIGKNRFFNICEAYNGMLGRSDSLSKDARRYKMINESLDGYSRQKMIDMWCEAFKNKICIVVSNSSILCKDYNGKYCKIPGSIFDTSNDGDESDMLGLESRLSSVMLFDTNNEARRFISSIPVFSHGEVDSEWIDMNCSNLDIEYVSQLKPVRVGNAIGGRYGVEESAENMHESAKHGFDADEYLNRVKRSNMFFTDGGIYRCDDGHTMMQIIDYYSPSKIYTTLFTDGHGIWSTDIWSKRAYSQDGEVSATPGDIDMEMTARCARMRKMLLDAYYIPGWFMPVLFSFHLENNEEFVLSFEKLSNGKPAFEKILLRDEADVARLIEKYPDINSIYGTDIVGKRKSMSEVPESVQRKRLNRMMVLESAPRRVDEMAMHRISSAITNPSILVKNWGDVEKVMERIMYDFDGNIPSGYELRTESSSINENAKGGHLSFDPETSCLYDYFGDGISDGFYNFLLKNGFKEESDDFLVNGNDVIQYELDEDWETGMPFVTIDVYEGNAERFSSLIKQFLDKKCRSKWMECPRGNYYTRWKILGKYH